jgi:hypothetical protein
MTAFSFHPGVLPLVVATGAGAEARVVMGMALLGGMTLATCWGSFSTPCCLSSSAKSPGTRKSGTLRLPAISLTGTLGVASTDLGAVTTEGGVWSIGGRLLGPIVDFGKNKRRVEIEEQRTQQALYQYENTVLTAFREVEDALVEIATYRNELAAVDRQQKAAKNANNLSKERYDKGVSSYLEVLDTERTLFSAELQQSDLQQQYRNAYVNLFKALGGGWISNAEREKNADPDRPMKYTTTLDATNVTIID